MSATSEKKKPALSQNDAVSRLASFVVVWLDDGLVLFLNTSTKKEKKEKEKKK